MTLVTRVTFSLFTNLCPVLSKFLTLPASRQLKRFFRAMFLKREAMFCFIFAWTSREFKSSRHSSAQAARGHKTLGSHLNAIWPAKGLFWRVTRRASPTTNKRRRRENRGRASSTMKTSLLKNSQVPESGLRRKPPR